MTKTNKLSFAAALAVLLLLVGTGARSAERADTDVVGCSEDDRLPVDVAGHLSIAANTDLRPLRNVWRWGAVPVGIAVDDRGSVVWAQYRTGTIERADRDGKRGATIARVDGPLGLAFDAARGVFFYTTDRHYPRTIGSLKPGEKPQARVCGVNVNRPFAIALARKDATLYWTESINGRIRSARTDGSGLSTLFDDGIATVNERAGAVALSPAGIAVDEERGFVFWSDLRTATITRARRDGSDRREILGRDQGLEFPTGLALDAERAKLYWADPGTETICRADLDGSRPEVVAGAADGVLEPYGLAIDAERRLLYWTDVARNALFRAALDRKGVERFVDLDAGSAPMPAAVRSESCDAALTRAREEFLRRWLKQVRTCVIGVTVTQAVIRSASGLALPAKSCTRQLALAHETSSLRAALDAHCDARQLAAAIDMTLQLGAEVIAADLPRAAPYLRKIRPFVAREGSPGSEQAVAAIDAIVQRLENIDRARAKTKDWTLPVSGQTTSYAAARADGGAGAAVGDDGAIRAGAPFSYVDNGDGTITDRNTGLTWEKKCAGCGGLHDASKRYRWRASGDGETDVTGWLQAINTEEGKGFGGHADWRLPQTDELLSIVDYERFNPAVSDAFDRGECAFGCTAVGAAECSCGQLGPYWTNAVSPKDGDVVPVVLFNLGLVLGQPADVDAFVRAVRGPVADRRERFVDNGDGTITDRRTRLMWEKKCRCGGSLHDVDRRAYWSFDGKQETIWDWLSDVNAEGGRGFAGHGDWRIPNVKELYSLVDGSRGDPVIDPVFHEEECAEPSNNARCSVTEEGLHWTSTSLADFPSLGMTIDFGVPDRLEREPPPGIIRVIGGVEPHEKTLRMVVRAVRGPVPASP